MHRKSRVTIVLARLVSLLSCETHPALLYTLRARMRRRIAKKPNPPKADSAMKRVCFVHAFERPCEYMCQARSYERSRMPVRNALADARERRLRSSVRSTIVASADEPAATFPFPRPFPHPFPHPFPLPQLSASGTVTRWLALDVR